VQTEGRRGNPAPRASKEPGQRRLPGRSGSENRGGESSKIGQAVRPRSELSPVVRREAEPNTDDGAGQESGQARVPTGGKPTNRGLPRRWGDVRGEVEGDASLCSAGGPKGPPLHGLPCHSGYSVRKWIKQSA